MSSAARDTAFRSAARWIAFVVTLLLATSAWAQTPRSVEGSVSVIDRDARVIVLENGQAVRIGPGTVVVHKGQTTTIVGLEPGMRVIVRDGELVTMREGQYVVVEPSHAPVVRFEFPAATVHPAPVVSPWCEGTYAATRGTNFGSCIRR